MCGRAWRRQRGRDALPAAGGRPGQGRECGKQQVPPTPPQPPGPGRRGGPYAAPAECRAVCLFAFVTQRAW